MFAPSFRRIAAFMAAYLLLAVVAAPFSYEAANSTLEARATHATQAAPHFVIYGDKYISGVTGPPTVSEIKACSRETHEFLILPLFVLTRCVF